MPLAARRLLNFQLLLNLVNLVPEMLVSIDKVINRLACMKHGGVILSAYM